MITKKTLIQASIVSILMLMFGWMLVNYKKLSIEKLAIAITTSLILTAYVEYYRRELIAKLKKQAKDQLRKQAKKLQLELYEIMLRKDWTPDQKDALMEMNVAFRKVNPWTNSDKNVKQRKEKPN